MRSPLMSRFCPDKTEATFHAFITLIPRHRQCDLRRRFAAGPVSYLHFNIQRPVRANILFSRLIDQIRSDFFSRYSCLKGGLLVFGVARHRRENEQSIDNLGRRWDGANLRQLPVYGL